MEAHRYRWDVPLIATICGLMFFMYLGTPLLWDRDEPRNAGCAREMWQTGDGIVPTFNGELRSQKPVLLYWLIMSAYTVFGVSEFSARFWSALLSTGTVLLTYWAGRRLFDRSVGFWGAIALGSSVMFTVGARAATPDACFIFFTSSALLLFAHTVVRAKTDEEATRLTFNYPAASGFYLLLGLAVLAKGPAGVVIPMAVVGLWSLVVTMPRTDSSCNSEGQLHRLFYWLIGLLNPRHVAATCWSLRPILGCGLILIVAAPWYIAVGLRTDMQFLHEFFLRENWERATTTFENHSGGWWFYPLALLVGFFPWSAFAVPTLAELDRRFASRRDPILLFFIMWIVVQVAIFTMAKTKLPSYVTPCYPALALITAWALVRWQRGEQLAPRQFFEWGFVALAVVGVAVGVGVGWASTYYLGGDPWLPVLCLPLIVGGFLAARACRARSMRRQSLGSSDAIESRQTVRASLALTTIGTASVAFTALTFGWGASRVDLVRRDNAVLMAIRAASEDTRVFSYRSLESSWVYYGEKTICELRLEPQSRATVPNVDAENTRVVWRAGPQPSPEELVERSVPALVVTTDRHVDELLMRLGNRFEVVATADYFTRKERMILLARKPNRTAAGFPARHER